MRFEREPRAAMRHAACSRSCRHYEDMIIFASRAARHDASHLRRHDTPRARLPISHAVSRILSRRAQQLRRLRVRLRAAAARRHERCQLALLIFRR